MYHCHRVLFMFQINSKQRDFIGCPVPVQNHPECHLPCPEGCQCHEGTGVCKRCDYRQAKTILKCIMAL